MRLPSQIVNSIPNIRNLGLPDRPQPTQEQIAEAVLEQHICDTGRAIHEHAKRYFGFSSNAADNERMAELSDQAAKAVFQAVSAVLEEQD